MNLRNVKVDLITVDHHHRKDFGDLQSLADSIGKHGLQQPIGVTKDNDLAYGRRRLKAVADILGWDRIPAVEATGGTLAELEREENGNRTSYTVTEKVALGLTIEAEAKVAAKERQKRKPKDSVPENIPEQNGQESRQVAAKAAGFGNETTYRQAKQAVKKGSADLIAAMDEGKISPSAAANVAELPKAEQTAAVKNGTLKDAAKRGAAKKKGEPVPKPPKKYSLSDEVYRVMQNVVAVTASIQHDHGGWEGAIGSSGWDYTQTTSCMKMLKVAESALSILNKGIGEDVEK